MKSSKDITLHVGHYFYDFNVKKIRLWAKPLKAYYPDVKLDHAFVFVYKEGKLEHTKPYCNADDPMICSYFCPDTFKDGAIDFYYIFPGEGMYSFKVEGYDKDGKKYETDDFYIGFEF